MTLKKRERSKQGVRGRGRDERGDNGADEVEMGERVGRAVRIKCWGKAGAEILMQKFVKKKTEQVQ